MNSYGVNASATPFARGADLEQRAALFGLERLMISLADPERNFDEVDESDDDLRARIQLGPTGFSVAGPADAYWDLTKIRSNCYHKPESYEATDLYALME